MAFPLVLITYFGFKFFKGTAIEFRSWKDWKVVRGSGTKMVNLKPAPRNYVEASMQTYNTEGEENNLEGAVEDTVRAASVEDAEVRVTWEGPDGAWEKEHHDAWAAEQAKLHPEDFRPDVELWWCPEPLRDYITLFYFPWDKKRE
jgi:hypothetical protein